MEDQEIIRLYWDRDEAAIGATDEKYGAYCTAIALNILHVAEGCLSHDTLGHNASCNCCCLSLQSIKSVLDFQAMMRYIIFCNLKRIPAAFL